MSYPPGPPGPHDADQPGPPGSPPGAPAPGPPPTNTKATAALITGITTLVLSWCCGFGVLGAIAILLGVRARSEIRDSRGTQEGDGIALAGIITGAVAIVIGVLVLALIIVVIATGQYYTDFR